MLKKRILTCLLVFVLLFLTACSSTGKCADDILVYGDTKSRDPLRICVDLVHGGSPDTEVMDDFLYRLENTAGISDVIIEYIPSQYTSGWGIKEDNSIRATAMDRIRAEIMAGGGPDVFIMQYHSYVDRELDGAINYDKTNCLFKYPEKAMENGLFLPLDELIENNTVLTEWDKLTQPVLEAGRNEEGQQIVPLNYQMPLLCYPKSVWEHIPDKKYTWNDMLTNPELLPYSLDMANFGQTAELMGSTETVFTEGSLMGLGLLFGDIADYENEEMTVTEEEIVNTVEQILSLEQKDSYEDIEQAEEIEIGEVDMSSEHFNKPMTFLPLYNMDGGVTVEIEKYAAVNRNTKRPEDAFKVIDLLMNKNFQQTSFLYNRLICPGYSMPLHEELFQESTPVGGMNRYMLDSNFAAFSKVREQITDAYFQSEGSKILKDVLSQCRSRNSNESDKTVEEIVHETYRDLERRVRE